jgi:hypothetical protein
VFRARALRLQPDALRFDVDVHAGDDAACVIDVERRRRQRMRRKALAERFEPRGRLGLQLPLHDLAVGVVHGLVVPALLLPLPVDHGVEPARELLLLVGRQLRARREPHGRKDDRRRGTRLLRKRRCSRQAE